MQRGRAAVQIGWCPESARTVTMPGVSAGVLLTLLRSLDGAHDRRQIVWQASESGIPPAAVTALLAELDEAGLLSYPARPLRRPRSIRVHGRGPLSDHLANALRHYGIRISRGAPGEAVEVARWQADFVVLADELMPDPHVAHDLVRAGIPHLQVRIRDGVGVVGPLVVPGRTSCLRCADLVRAGYDPQWPQLAAQLLGRVGHAGAATVQATAALALGELEVLLTSTGRVLPKTLDATVEFDLATHTLRTRQWSRQPTCYCATTGAEQALPASMP